jgi:hypothetical protein
MWLCESPELAHRRLVARIAEEVHRDVGLEDILNREIDFFNL